MNSFLLRSAHPNRASAARRAAHSRASSGNFTENQLCVSYSFSTFIAFNITIGLFSQNTYDKCCR
ncbi:hypothetical protein DDR33_10830 [Pararcticibacter amylolyticus]|uniref:Uncharacterized protein n=1 Tax=Pararcticibacter amylolyticus TaxID=2173175 RepID=A0A2U2PGX9_9SPHI|nr:hypothetical protein DDR33_10830 [Pararcticibacter amylolyticus]